MASLLVFVTFFQAVRRSIREPRFRAITGLFLALIGGGTVFYHYVEGWRWIDSVYFCVISLATVGYGDLSPQTDLGKIFTIAYVLVGVGAVVAFATAVFEAAVANRERAFAESAKK
jgi:voltage-gated potassium channel Kch